MKYLYSETRFFLIALLLLVSTLKLEAQIRDLANMAEGELELGTILRDADAEVYGYFYIFKQGDISKTKSQYEYVFLDRNLNKAANGKFEENKEKSVRTVSEFIGARYMGNGNVLLSKYFTRQPTFGEQEFVVSYNRIISIKDKTVSPAFAYEDDNKLVDLPEDIGEVRSKYSKYKINNLVRGISTGDAPIYLIIQSSREYAYQAFNEKNIKAFDIDKSPLWTYTYNEGGKKSNWNAFSFLDVNDNSIIINKENKKGETTLKHTIVALDLKTGESKFEYLLEDRKATYNHRIHSTETYNNKHYLAGNYGLYSKKGYNWEKSLGFFQIVLDEKGNELSKKYITWAEIAADLAPNKHGKLKGGYLLSTTTVFQFKNGSFSVLTEKFKKESSGVFIPIPLVSVIVQAATQSSAKSTDFVLFNFDVQGNFKDKQVIEKDKTKHYFNDYLFSQSIKEGNGVAFFFRDYKKDEETKEKNWILGINTIIDGEFKQEIIPMSSDDFSISPMPAKEGYILLREYNDKSKYNQLRLEKLNY